MSYEDQVTDFQDVRFTIPEAAFLSGVRAKDINREIDANIVPAEGRGERRVRGSELFYLSAIKEVRTHIDRPLRRHLRQAIVDAVKSRSPEARVHAFIFSLDLIGRDLAEHYNDLERSRPELIESHADVLGGEPVIRGTRISARHVAELLRRGASHAEVREDLDLTDSQIEAAVVFDCTTPRRGRPARRPRTAHVPAA